ncbi:MAG: hypothetical protein QOH41_819 [Blastocatellia bacterium]|jgi:hypothetical protein|nr:hypothetical protein [Blastocatellia bacterium]
MFHNESSRTALIEPAGDVLQALNATPGLAAPILSATGQGDEAVCHRN